MMKKNTIHNIDCIEGMRQIAGGSVDLIVADPPYNLKKDFGIWKEEEREDEWLTWTKVWIDECNRILKPGGNIFIYGIHHHLCWIQCYLYEINLTYRRQIIWNYENGFGGYTKSLSSHYEPILWFSKGENYTYHVIREPYKSQERLRNPVYKNGREWTPHPDGRRVGDVWRFPVLAGKRFEKERVNHPTQKPLSISYRIIEHFSDVGNLVVVPFAGSGTECVAAISKGREFIGFELNENYIKIANERLGLVLASADQPF